MVTRFTDAYMRYYGEANIPHGHNRYDYKTNDWLDSVMFQ